MFDGNVFLMGAQVICGFALLMLVAGSGTLTKRLVVANRRINADIERLRQLPPQRLWEISTPIGVVRIQSTDWRSFYEETVVFDDDPPQLAAIRIAS